MALEAGDTLKEARRLLDQWYRSIVAPNQNLQALRSAASMLRASLDLVELVKGTQFEASSLSALRHNVEVFRGLMDFHALKQHPRGVKKP